MDHVCVGIHIHAEPDRLRATLASLRANTSQPIELLLLPDGPDQATRAALATLHDLPQSGTEEPLGPPACFNRLATAANAKVLILLESGTLVGPGWLDHLLAALKADARNGLAGPSTNRAWNEQCVIPNCSGKPAEIARAAQDLHRRFGGTWRTLEPLHSLADFCYVVRREVIEAIGAADESYGLGPCWEMDYNIRAARAGFRGVWACTAFVYRSPFTARRQREETLRFQFSKQRYQDKFCALRLRGERTDYESHCRGEACEYFAPPELIQLRLPLPAKAQPVMPKPLVPLPAAVGLTAAISAPAALPLVSCIMPTCNRSDFVMQSIKYFQRQDYPERELIIIDDGVEDISKQLPDDQHVRYLHLPSKESIGAKRNRAVEIAQGGIIAHWDDDDWYAPTRLSEQVKPLLDGKADITALPAGTFFDLPRWEFWTCTPDLHRRLFVADVHGGTLVYQRRVWQRWSRYPATSLAEDAHFLRQAIHYGARLCRLRNDGLFIYLRHAHNAWAFACGRYPDFHGWQRVGEPLLPAEDREFYAAHSPNATILSSCDRLPYALGQPLVSCIMPTADRREFVPQAIRYFLRQDYPNRELIVIDDGNEAAADLIPSDSRIRYLRLEGKRTLGMKRNLACENARGEIIVHWDDDDWMADWRISYQVQSLLKEQADICGLDKLFFYDTGSNQSWQYVYPNNSMPWVAGGTLCYTKVFWNKNPFPNQNVGEDTRFVWNNCSKKMLALQKCTFYIALIHRRNTSSKWTQDKRWHPYSTAEIKKIIGMDWDFYADLLH